MKGHEHMDQADQTAFQMVTEVTGTGERMIKGALQRIWNWLLRNGGHAVRWGLGKSLEGVAGAASATGDLVGEQRGKHKVNHGNTGLVSERFLRRQNRHGGVVYTAVGSLLGQSGSNLGVALSDAVADEAGKQGKKTYIDLLNRNLADHGVCATLTDNNGVWELGFAGRDQATVTLAVQEIMMKMIAADKALKEAAEEGKSPATAAAEKKVEDAVGAEAAEELMSGEHWTDGERGEHICELTTNDGSTAKIVVTRDGVAECKLTDPEGKAERVTYKDLGSTTALTDADLEHVKAAAVDMARAGLGQTREEAVCERAVVDEALGAQEGFTEEQVAAQDAVNRQSAELAARELSRPMYKAQAEALAECKKSGAISHGEYDAAMAGGTVLSAASALNAAGQDALGRKATGAAENALEAAKEKSGVPSSQKTLRDVGAALERKTAETAGKAGEKAADAARAAVSARK